MGINQSRPECSATPNACLNQVIGYTDGNGYAQFQSCVAQFGAPEVEVGPESTVTVFSTEVATVSYTDVVIEVSTVYTTVADIVTSYSDVLETVTEFTATATSTVQAFTTLQPAKKRALKKRGCRSRTTTSSGVTSVPTSTSESSTSTSETTTSTSETPTSSTTPPPFPIASNCPNVEQYSSACSCIYAVSSVSTYTPPAETSVVTVVETSSIPVVSTSTQIVVSTVISTSVDLETRTLTSTALDISSTTTTSTSTTSLAAPTPTQGKFRLANNARGGRYITVVNQYVQYDYSGVGASAGADIYLPSGGGPLSLQSNHDIQMYVHTSTVSYGVLYFETAAQAGTVDHAVTCAVGSSGVVSCNAPSKGFNTIYSCGAYMYLGTATWTQSGCIKVNWVFA